MMRNRNLLSVICNTVHDSIVLDVHPDEKEACINLLADCMLAIPTETLNRYGFEYDMPVGIELKLGKNWLDLEEVLTV
jgi:DNA polymerase I-like protein with 3'-5' exonuclease and polymerase domains